MSFSAKFLFLCLIATSLAAGRHSLEQKDEGWRWRRHLQVDFTVIPPPEKPPMVVRRDFTSIHQGLGSIEQKASQTISPAQRTKNVAVMALTLAYSIPPEEPAQAPTFHTLTMNIQALFVSGLGKRSSPSAIINGWPVLQAMGSIGPHADRGKFPLVCQVESEIPFQIGELSMNVEPPSLGPEEALPTYSSDVKNLFSYLGKKYPTIETELSSETSIAKIKPAGWGGSYVDAEQTARIFFDKNYQKLLLAMLEKIPKGPSKIQADALICHVHSTMDLCSVCTASLRAQNFRFNREYQSRKSQRELGQMLPLVINGADITYNPRFGLLTLASSRTPYHKSAHLACSENASTLNEIRLPEVSRRECSGHDGCLDAIIQFPPNNLVGGLLCYQAPILTEEDPWPEGTPFSLTLKPIGDIKPAPAAWPIERAKEFVQQLKLTAPSLSIESIMRKSGFSDEEIMEAIGSKIS